MIGKVYCTPQMEEKFEVIKLITKVEELSKKFPNSIYLSVHQDLKNYYEQLSS